MPGLVLYCMGSPFRRVARVEFVYGASSVQALDPVAPLLDADVYDNVGVVFVPDIYSVWPEVGLFPRVTTYREVLEGLEEFMGRKCGIRLAPRMCGRVRFFAVPWSGVMGAWRFTGWLGDALMFMAYRVAEVISERRPSTVYVVWGEDTHPALGWAVGAAGLLASALAGAGYKLVYAEPRPYPAEKGAESILYDVEELDWMAAARRLAGMCCGAGGGRLLEARTPKAARLARLDAVSSSRDYSYTLATCRFYCEGMLLPLLYQACGAQDPLSKLARLLGDAVEAYVAATELHKKVVGGNLVHHLTVNLHSLQTLVGGVALEAAILHELRRRGLSCEQLYREGLEERVVREVASLLGLRGDSTPAECVEARDGRIRLAEGCMAKLRRSLSAQG